MRDHAVNSDKNNKNHALTPSYPSGLHSFRTVTRLECPFWMVLVNIHCYVAQMIRLMGNKYSDLTLLLPPSQGNESISDSRSFLSTLDT